MSGVHILKLCVGADRIEDLRQWQARQILAAKAAGLKPLPVCGTRAWPKRRAEVLAGGSLYWVIGGLICVRQPILAIEPVTDDHGERCGLYLDPALTVTEPQPRRAFQGWRYLDLKDAPRDLDAAAGADALPEDLRKALVALGAW